MPTRSRKLTAVAATSVLAAVAFTMDIVLTTATPVHAAACVDGTPNDFNGDGTEDLAIGLAHYEVDGYLNAGKVFVDYRGALPAVSVTQNTTGVPGGAEDDDLFGFATAAYDSNGDGCDDLVAGAPGESFGTEVGAGMVWVIPGSPNGLNFAAAVAYSQDHTGFPGATEPGDEFGRALAAGDLHDGEPYLLIGSPGETHNAVESGAVYYLRGGTVRVFHQDLAAVPGSQENADRFGETLAAAPGAFAVGSPGESIGTRAAAGMVTLFSQDAATAAPLWALSQNSVNVSGTSEVSDVFGEGLAATPYRMPGLDEVGTLFAIGSPGEALGGTAGYGDGMAQLFYLSPDGSYKELSTVSQDNAGVAGVAEDNDLFGSPLLFAGRVKAADPGPADVVLAVGVGGEISDGEQGDGTVVQAFSLDKAYGDGDAWVTSGAYGLPNDPDLTALYPRATGGHLWLDSFYGDTVYGVPWANIADGDSDPVVTLTP